MAKQRNLGVLRTIITAGAGILGLAVHGGAAANNALPMPRAKLFSAADLSQAPAIGTGGPAVIGKDTAGSAILEIGFLPGPQAVGQARTNDDSAQGALVQAAFLTSPGFSKVPGEPWAGFGPVDLGRKMAQIDRDLDCLALNIYFESLSEPEAGKIAVAHVVMNRVADRRFPNSVCEVIRQGGERVRDRCQFSWWCDGRSDLPHNARRLRAIKDLAREAYWRRSEDPTGGALWYHADYVSPYWRTAFEKGPTFGRHIFYRDKAKRAQLASRAAAPAAAQ